MEKSKRPVGIGIDPGGGGKTGGTGLAVADFTTGAPISLSNCRGMEPFLIRFRAFLENDDFDIKVVVVEDYKLDTWRAQQQGGSRMDAVQIIGAVKTLCSVHKLKPPVIQDRKHRKTGEKWSQIAEPADHSISHMYSAYNHLFYYLVRYHNVPTADERTKQNEKS